MVEISKVKARWILDSRGNPTVECDLWAGNIFARAAVPSGASTGSREALELRDGDKTQFGGKHVLKAVSNVNDIIADKVIGMDVTDQKALDGVMIELDGTENKATLGANAILAVSMAALKAGAQAADKKLYEYIYELTYGKPAEKYLMPVPGSNVLNGGKHAGTALSIQEFMILPLGATSFPECVQMVAETYQKLKGLLEEKYGKSAINVGDEGGFAPQIETTRETLDIMVEAIAAAGYEGKLFLGLDSAASEFYKEDSESYWIDGTNKSPAEMVDYYLALAADYPIKSFEDPFKEGDFDSFTEFTSKVPAGINVVTDDLTVTNPKILREAISRQSGNTLLMKVNQIGSITESIEAAKEAFDNDWGVMVSHRSGETEDTTIADIAVGFSSGIIKTGAPCRTDRNAKYNQLLRISEELGDRADYPMDGFKSWKAYH
jgi:enolase